MTIEIEASSWKFDSVDVEIKELHDFWIASTMAHTHTEVSHSLIVLPANDAQQAYARANNMALRRWPLKDGWVGHHAIVTKYSELVEELFQTEATDDHNLDIRTTRDAPASQD